MFRFEEPLWFLLLLGLLPVFWRFKTAGRPRLKVPTLAMKESLPFSFFARTRWIVPAMKVVALTLMVIALARPQWGTRETVRLNEGINIVLVMDSSESMSALDFRIGGKVVDRLEAVKTVVREFIRKREGDRIGLVVFGSEAYTQMPLTTDRMALISAVDRLQIGAAGQSTALGDAIGIALKRVRDSKAANSIVIVLTDGRSNSGELDPDTAADLARSLGVKVYTIGVGGREPAPFRVRDPFFGERIVYQQVEIDEQALRRIAEKTGGQYFHAERSDTLQKVYATIDQMEKTEIQVRSRDDFNDLYFWPLLPAVVLMAASGLLSQWRYLEVP